MDDKEKNIGNDIEENKDDLLSQSEETEEGTSSLIDKEESTVSNSIDKSKEETTETSEDNEENNEEDNEIEEEDDIQVTYGENGFNEEPINTEEGNKKKKNKLPLIILGIVIAILIGFIGTVGYFIFNIASDVSNEIDKITGNENQPVVEKIDIGKQDEVVDKAKDILDKTKDKSTNLNLPSIPSKEEDKVSDYYTFDNSYNNIKFEYPKYWTEIPQFQIKETEENVKNVIMVGYPPNSPTIDNMRITIEETPISVTSKEYFRETEERMVEIFPKFQIKQKGETTVSGREAPTRIYRWVPETELEKSPYKQEWLHIQQYQVYVAGQSKVYIVTFTSDEHTFEEKFEEYQRILTTLELGD